MIGIGLVLLLTSMVSAEFWACFSRGDRINYCNPVIPDRTCGSSICKYCMRSFDESNSCYSSGNWMVCNAVGEECGSVIDNGGGTTIDGEPPVLTINYPIEGEVYNSRRILLDFDLDEEADVYYLDNINGRGRWTRVCSDCMDYERSRSFKEGFNDLTFKAIDPIGNTAYTDISFTIDSRKPKIRKTLPRKGFADGNFEVQFSEENPVSLVLNYGNYITGYREQVLDIDHDCYMDRKRYYCDTNVALNDYDGQEIGYWFELEDIAGTKDESKSRDLEVDTTFPVLNNEDSFYEIDGRYVYFTFNITEKNFDEAEYIDWTDSRPRYRRLCSRLRDGICTKRRSFRNGHHTLDIQVVDEAGNSIAKRIEFDIDY